MDSNLFQKLYSREAFLEIIRELMPSQFKEDVQNITLPDSIKVVENAQLLGMCKLDDEPLIVFEVEHSAGDSARVSISNDAFKIMRDHDCIRALVAFKSKMSVQWRLSLMTIDYRLDDKGKVTTDISNPRRYSFLLGPGAKVHTPSKQLNKKVKDFDDLLSRFSLEVVNKDFYNSIAILFTELVGGTRSVNKKKQEFPGLLKLPRTLSINSYQEFAVRLIGRIVFCWFLKEKKSEDGIPLMPNELLSLEASKMNDNYYETILEKLFFETLNVEIDSRDKRYLEDSYKLVPYLNGGLFEPHDGDFYKDSKTIPDDWLTRLLEIFETYNFTIDENTISDVDLSIDPEMLGRIFENLLAEINPETGESARKSTGSFYTPREIVNYMVDESLVEILVEKTGIERDKINALVTSDKLDDLEFPLTQDQKEIVVNAVAELKILDPACGSGAFPIGILQKISMILQRADPDATMWFDKQTKSIPDPLLRNAVKEKFKNENLDWVRKLGIIKDVIYGVDIQPIAVEIAKLRCFLTLVVEEKIDDSQPNRGIQPLPNLDFKFVAANSLVQLEAAELNLLQDNDLQQKLADVRSKYFNSKSQIEKTKLREKYKVLNNAGSLSDDARTLQLRSFDPFINNKSAGFFDSEYMFGIRSGFDVVIGNPPYISALAAKRTFSAEAREALKKSFSSAKGAYDIYLIFFELGIKLLSTQGILCFISPAKYVSAKYAESFRSKFGLDYLLRLAEFSNSKVFESAGVTTMISFFKFEKDREEITTEKYASRSMSSFQSFAVPRRSLEEFPEKIWGHLLTGNYRVLSKIYRNSDILETTAKVNGSSTANEGDRFSEYVTESPTNNSLKIVNTGNISRYKGLWGIKEFSNKGQKLLKPYVMLNDVGQRRIDMYRAPKIIISKLSKRLTAMIDLNGEYASTNTTFVYDPVNRVDLLILGALLNSKAMNFVYQNMFSGLNLLGSFQFQAPQIRILPIPHAVFSGDKYGTIITLVNKLLDEDVLEKSFDSVQIEIDKLVYEMFDLNSEEIQLIENSHLP